MSPALPHIVVVGAGPAGLAAAERLLETGPVRITLVERMPSPARKFLIAGRGGLNLTHSEPAPALLARYGGSAADLVAAAIARFSADDLRRWSADLGEETFVGSSGRVFPKSFKASPLLRAWLARLAAGGAVLETRARWIGFDAAGRPLVETADATRALDADATILALGGASWPRLGSDGAWTEILGRHAVPITPLAPMNVGVTAAWTEIFRERFAGQPSKRIAIGVEGSAAPGEITEAIVTAHGLEGTGIYARSAAIGEALDARGAVMLHLDLRPDLDTAALTERIAGTHAKRSTADRLRRAGLAPVAVGLMREATGGPLPAAANELAALAKDCCIAVTGLRPMERAISTRGGIRREALGDDLELKALPGVFVAGEMLDWHAPTGGYLLQGSIATGRVAADGVRARLGA